MVLRIACNAVITSCSWTSNTANNFGGALFIDYGSSPLITSNSFTSNTATYHGGAIYAYDSIIIFILNKY